MAKARRTRRSLRKANDEPCAADGDLAVEIVYGRRFGTFGNEAMLNRIEGLT
jgi:hypothetical protein